MSYQIGPMDPEDRAGHFLEGADAPPRRVAAIFAVVVVMAVFAGGLWFAYTTGVRHSTGGGTVPLIRADGGPTKVKPQNPGGMKIPDRNLSIYNERRPTVERLLPGPEQPMPRPAPPPPKPAVAAAAAPPVAPAVATPPAQAAAPPPPPAAAPRETPAGPAAASSPQAKPASPRPAVAAAPVAAGGVALQLGALRSEAAAHQEWERIKRAHGDLLGKLSAKTVRADLGDKGVFWRIETAPIADRAAAVRLCTQLKQRNIGCLLAR
jgi:sporulation related protein